MRIAVFGDIHGRWCEFRDAVQWIHDHTPLDLVLQCGDAQPCREKSDLEYMACPRKYRLMGDFSYFVEGWEDFPVPLLFVGGNHEPYNVLDGAEDEGAMELVPNVEYMGRCSRKQVGDLEIVGISGIYDKEFYDQPRPDWPYSEKERRQAAYFRREDIERAMLFEQPHILLLHEWPDEMNKVRDHTWPDHWKHVGAKPLTNVLDYLLPRYCFCAHMHKVDVCKSGRTDIVCLSDFVTDSENAYVVLDTETEEYQWDRHALYGKG